MSYNFFKDIRIILGWLVLLAALPMISMSAVVPRPRIVILAGSKGKPYQDARAAITAYLEGQITDIQIHSLVIDRNADFHQALTSILEKEDPDLFVTLGSEATQVVTRNISDRPVISGLNLTPDLLLENNNSTGVYLRFSIKDQLQWLRWVVPTAKRVGVLYNPVDNRETIAEAEFIATELGLELMAKEVKSPKDFPAALKSILRRVDIMWGIPDQTVISPQTTKMLLLSSFRQKIPFIGLSEKWVKAGALYSLAWNYEDLGVQCGEMVEKILSGVPVESIRPEPPRLAKYAVNLRTADHMKLDLSAELIQNAARVFN